jgi:hypothetical protein
LLDAFAALLQAERDKYSSSAELPPMALLWPDPDRQWNALAPMLRDRELPLLTLDDYDPATQTGPAIWIRSVLGGYMEQGITPVIYLPGFGIRDLRSEEEADAALRPLLFLGFLGRVFLAPNSKDWTIAAFLQNEKQGLGIPVDSSGQTRTALVNTLPFLARKTIAELRAHPGGIDADYLNSLIVTDLPKQILLWIDNPDATRAALDETGWGAFRGQMTAKYQIDPERDGPSEAAARLGGAEPGSSWQAVWDRFAEAPASYPAIKQRLRGAKSSQASLLPNFHWPQDNEAAEDALRSALLALKGKTESEVRARLLELETTHAERRACVWAALGEAPLAFALSHLATIAQTSALPPNALEAQIAMYTESGWRIDDAALRAAQMVEIGPDRAAVDAALSAVYAPWLWNSAERFQTAFKDLPVTGRPESLSVLPGTCVLFVDGLRFDAGKRLEGMLVASGKTVTIEASIGPQPGITNSAKPAITPNAGKLVAGGALDAFEKPGGPTVTKAVQDRLLKAQGWLCLSAHETGMPTGTERAWTELGQIDGYGHSHPENLPRQIDAELHLIRQRVEALLAGGWNQVVIVTDHGWLLTPEPMAKTELPAHLTVQRKGRCARLTTGASVSVQTIPWVWDANVAIAVAPGISCFEEGKRYEHGGLSLQECVIPTLTVRSGAAAKPALTITGVKWTNLRVEVALSGDATGYALDLRTKAGSADSSLLPEPVPITGASRRFLVDNDEHEGSAGIVVLLDGLGAVIAQHSTIVGGY